MSRRERDGRIVLPGAALGSTQQPASSGSADASAARAGEGTRADETTQQVRAVVLGRATVIADATVAVRPLFAPAPAAQSVPTAGRVPLAACAPRPGCSVLLRVTKVQNIGAGGPIVAIDGRWCAPTFRGFVRLDDIRSATAKEAAAGLVPTHAGASYRLGDLVCADVISLTEARQFQLTTTPPHCGVVKVFSERPTDGAFNFIPSTSGAAGAHRRDLIEVETDDGFVEVSRWVPAVPLGSEKQVR
jgi:exosome complex RNA-binding protein Csl4